MFWCKSRDIISATISIYSIVNMRSKSLYFTIRFLLRKKYNIRLSTKSTDWLNWGKLLQLELDFYHSSFFCFSISFFLWWISMRCSISNSCFYDPFHFNTIMNTMLKLLKPLQEWWPCYNICCNILISSLIWIRNKL